MNSHAATYYHHLRHNRLIILVLSLILLLILLLLDLTTGASGMPLKQVWQAFLVGADGDIDGKKTTVHILWQIRMPPTLMSVLVGACLGLSGLQMQTILANPLASPFTLGFSAAAGFGAALAIMFGGIVPLPNYIVTPISAFLMTLIACGLIYLIAIFRSATPEVLVLGGIAVLFFFQSLQSLLQYLAVPEVLQQIVFWLFGDLQKATWTSIRVALVILLLCLPFIARDIWALTTLRLGDSNAQSLGINVEKIRKRTFILVALLTAAAVSFVGTIGFIGLIAPHTARYLVGEDHRFSLPISAIIGAIILLAASVASKMISAGAQIPVGVITAIAGVPMLFFIIIHKKTD